jgi:hypothetical protein
LSFFAKLEKKFGKFAIRNLPIKIAVVMAISYILWAFVPTFAVKLVFSPYAILEQHEFWRLFTWVFSPPGDFEFSWNTDDIYIDFVWTTDRTGHGNIYV